MKIFKTTPYKIEANWFDDMSPNRKKAYIKKYPTSKYAKQAIAEGDPEIVPEKTPEKVKPKKIRKVKTSPEKMKKSSEPQVNLNEESKPVTDEVTTKEESPKEPVSEREQLKEELRDEIKEDIKKELKEELSQEFEPSSTPDYLQKKPSLSEKFKSFLGKRKLPPSEKAFFEEGGTEPGSTARKMVAEHISKRSGLIVSHLKETTKEWKTGMKAIHKFAQRKPLDHQDKEALKSISKDILIATALVGIGGGLGHGILAAVSHIGFDVIKETILKAAANGIVASKISIRSTTDDQDEQFMAMIVKQLGKHIEQGDIPEDSWMYAADSIASDESPEEQVEENLPKEDSKEMDKVESSVRILHLITSSSRCLN